MEPGANQYACPLSNEPESSAPNSEAEIVTTTLTRSTSLPGEPHSTRRPTTLHISPQPEAVLAALNVHIHADAEFVQGEEETTPDGGKSEFVGHAYRCPLINNGETVVTPDASLSPPNMVVGYKFPLEAYRRQFSDNSHQRHHAAAIQSDGPHQAVRRRSSEPPRIRREHHEIYYIDNNGREVILDPPNTHNL